jgi:type II secretory pathway pseudopilin PulG
MTARTSQNDRRRTRRAGAFTLVEVLATMTFLAIVLPSIMQGLSLCLATAGNSRDVAAAASLAQAKLEELSALGELQASASTGDFGANWPSFHWKAVVTDWESDTLKELAVTVWWTRHGREREVTLTTLVYMGLPDETSG